MASDGVRTHHVAIVNDHGRRLVVPGQLVAATGDEVVFHSVAAGEVTLLFPLPVLLDPATGRHADRRTVAAGGSAAFTVRLGDKLGAGSYTYMAYCADTDDLALGASQPKIIIYQ